MNERDRVSSKATLSLAAVALLLRLLVCLQLPTDVASLAKLPDQVEYLECGRNLLHGVGLSFVDPRFDQRVYAYRMPGYPLLIAACGGSVTVVRIVQCLLDASTVAAVYLLARRYFDPRWALLAAAAVAFNPFQIYFTGLLLSETVFISLLIWGLTLLPLPVPGERAGERAFDFLRLYSQPTTGLPAILFLCLSTLVRPSATLLPLLLTARNRRHLLVSLVLEALLLTTWAYRNHRLLGEWIFTTTNSGISAYDGLNPAATGASDQRFIAAMPDLQSMSETQRNDTLGRLANEFAVHHPLPVIQLAAIKLARLWSPIPLSQEYGTNLKLVAISLIYSVPLDSLVLIGLFFGRLPRGVKLYLVTPALYFSIVHAVGVGSLRYRIPADVPLTIVAVSGAAACFRKWYGQTSAHA